MSLAGGAPKRRRAGGAGGNDRDKEEVIATLSGKVRAQLAIAQQTNNPAVVQVATPGVSLSPAPSAITKFHKKQISLFLMIRQQ